MDTLSDGCIFLRIFVSHNIEVVWKE